MSAGAAELGELLDAADAAAFGDSNDDEIDTLRRALECATEMLEDMGVEIPRSFDPETVEL